MDDLQNKLRKIFENMDKFHFVGTCVNSFDDDGDSLIPYFSDATDFAQKEEESTQISKHTFINSVSDYSMLPTNSEYEFSQTLSGDLLMAYNIKDDVHYFFGR